MAINSESQNRKLFGFLEAQNFKNLKAKDENGEQVLDLNKAVEFSFVYKFHGQELGEVTITADNGEIAVYYTDAVMDAKKDTEWSTFLQKLKQWGIKNGFTSFKFNNNLSKLQRFRQQRKQEKMEEQLLEGYYGTKTTSYSDSAPTGIKLIIKHNRNLEETDQRFRHIERIFLETQAGERLLLPTRKPSIARAYARHLAEGGEHNDERWRHITEIADDIGKLAGFVRATARNQFNESVAQIINETLQHYQKLRETIKRIQGSRGYQAYFENWQPTLMEQGNEHDFAGLFKTSALDPRIENALPVLQKLNIKYNEINEASEFESWANNVVEGLNSEQEKKAEELAKLLDQDKIDVGVDGISLKMELDELIDDQKVFDEMSKEIDDLKPNLDAKPAIMSVVIKHGDDEFFDTVNRKLERGETSSSGKVLQKAVTTTPEPSASAKPIAPAGATSDTEKFMPLPESEQSELVLSRILNLSGIK